MKKCVKNSSLISNCIDFNDDENGFCNLCKDGYFLFKDKLAPYECIDNNFKIENCEIYSKGPDYKCIQCLEDFFIIEIKYFLKNICLHNNKLVNNCLNYDENNNFTCSNCEKKFSIIKITENKKLCLHDNNKISNCQIYNENFECKKYNKICTSYNTQDCPICEENLILVNGKCYNICSKEAKNCEICQQRCPLYLCLKLVPFCQECGLENFSECIRCPEYLVLKDGKCVEKNDNSFFFENLRCEDGCEICIGYLCVKCKFDYYWDQNKFVCLKKQNLIGKIMEKDECKEKELICMIENKLKFSHCQKCRSECKCTVEYRIENSFLNCEKNSVIFEKKESIKFVEMKEIFLNYQKTNELKITFKNNATKQTFFQIPKKLIFSTTNCSLDFIKSIKVQNKKSPKITIDKTTKFLIKYSSSIIPIFSNFLSNSILAHLLMVSQIQEIFSYLFLINFNGGPFFESMNYFEFDFKSFEDIVNNKNFYEKKFIFTREKYNFLNFLEFMDLIVVLIFLVKQIFIFVFVLIKTFYYYKTNRDNFHFEYFVNKMENFKMNFKLFLKSFFLVLTIKYLPKSKKFFYFHNLFKNSFYELFFFFFNFSFIFYTFSKMKDTYDFSRKKDFYKNTDFNNDFYILKKTKFMNENIILNRFILYNNLLFFFRAMILQNYFENPTLCKILIFISFLIYIIYLLINILKKKTFKIIIYFIFVNEIIFLIYFILGLDFFEEIISKIVLNIFYIVCNISKIIEAVFFSIFIYFKNKKKKIQKKKKKNFKKISIYKERFDFKSGSEKKNFKKL